MLKRFFNSSLEKNKQNKKKVCNDVNDVFLTQAQHMCVAKRIYMAGGPVAIR